MAYQFAHLQLHSRSGCISAKEKERRTGKASHGTARSRGRRPIRSIFGELAREAKHCTHVAEPRTPVIVYDSADPNGVDPCSAVVAPSSSFDHAVAAIAAAEARHDAIVEKARLVTKAGVARRLPPQALTLRADVHSWPEPVAAFASPDHDPMLFQTWMAEVIDYARTEIEACGGTVEIAVLHLDEAHPHLHVLSTHPDGLVRCLDPGCVAFEVAKANGASLAKANEARADAKRDWQNRLHENVSAKFGQARFGPRRQRLTAHEWHQQRAEQDAVRKQTEQRLRDEKENKEIEAERARLLEKLAMLDTEMASRRTEAEAEAARAEAARKEVGEASRELKAVRDECRSANEVRNRSVRQEASARRQTRKLRKSALALESRCGKGQAEVDNLERRYLAGCAALRAQEGATAELRSKAETIIAQAEGEAKGIRAEADREANETRERATEERREGERLRLQAKEQSERMAAIEVGLNERNAELSQRAAALDTRRSELNGRETNLDLRQQAVASKEAQLAKRSAAIAASAKILQADYKMEAGRVIQLAADLQDLLDAIPEPLRPLADELIANASNLRPGILPA